MKILKTRFFLGTICFVLGIGATLLVRHLTYEGVVGQTRLSATPPRKSLDPLFDQFYNDDFFGSSSDPFEQMRKMRKQVLEQFDQPEGDKSPFDSWYRKRFGGGDAGEIKKREDQDYVYYDIKIEGLDKEKLHVKVADGQISIDGRVEKKSEADHSGSYYSSSFHRSFPVPLGVDPQKFQMDQDQTQLILKFPKTKGRGA